MALHHARGERHARAQRRARAAGRAAARPRRAGGPSPQGSCRRADEGGMERGLYIAASGMLAEQVRQDQIANDLANASTPGYKADRATQGSFGDLLLQNTRPAQTIGPLGTARGSTRQVTDLHRRSRCKDTGEPLDFAIVGDGFFAVADAAGHALHAQRPVHAPPPTAARRPAAATPCSAGTASRSRSAPTARSTRAASASSPSPTRARGRQPLHRHRRAAAATGQVRSGALEGSGADPARSMVDMIASLRAFEAGQKVIQTIDETLQQGRDPGRLDPPNGGSTARPPTARASSSSASDDLPDENRKHRLDRHRGSRAPTSGDPCSKDCTPPPPAWRRSSSASTASPTTWRTPTRPATSTCASASATCSTSDDASGNVHSGAGAAATIIGRGFTQGALRETGNPLDVAIQGEGFLRVRRADGPTALTRDGSLRLDARGRLTTQHRRARPAADHGPGRARRADRLDRRRRHGHRRQPPGRPHPARHRPLARRACSRSATTSSATTAASGAARRRRRAASRRAPSRPPTSTSATRWSR